VFDTPVISQVLRWVSRLVLRLRRWRMVVHLPDTERFVAVFAPHTSYWDLPLMVMAAFANRVRGHWLGTHNLFRRPFGWFFRWLGGIPVDRTRSNGIVAVTVEEFATRGRFVLGVAPEGTRFPGRRWKTGFYHIAAEAGVPLVLVFLDTTTRTIGAGDWFVPTGDLDADAGRIRRFYAGKMGIRAARTAPPVIGSED
jgi:1-acyl-sn-glycerol-3-phosphate acyltransferase